MLEECIQDCDFNLDLKRTKLIIIVSDLIEETFGRIFYLARESFEGDVVKTLDVMYEGSTVK